MCPIVEVIEKEHLVALHVVYNIGNSQPINLLDFVQIKQVEDDLLPQDYNFAAHTELIPMQPSNVIATYADTSQLERDFGFVIQLRCAKDYATLFIGIEISICICHLQ